ncbi:MAG: hypothetical protein K0S86_5625 [Geminicoccaceae bacterium]|nr:hypothetical protein [Geminicoccaceae bacterium]
MWRKRRLRLAEAALNHRGLQHAVEPFRETAKAALVHLEGRYSDLAAAFNLAGRGERAGGGRSFQHGAT